MQGGFSMVDISVITYIGNFAIYVSKVEKISIEDALYNITKSPLYKMFFDDELLLVHMAYEEVYKIYKSYQKDTVNK